jgi:hypothetical protein
VVLLNVSFNQGAVQLESANEQTVIASTIRSALHNPVCMHIHQNTMTHLTKLQQSHARTHTQTHSQLIHFMCIPEISVSACRGGDHSVDRERGTGAHRLRHRVIVIVSPVDTHTNNIKHALKSTSAMLLVLYILTAAHI